MVLRPDAEGTIDCDRDGLLYTSVPQNGNWSVKVDGKPAEIKLVGDCMVAVNLTQRRVQPWLEDQPRLRRRFRRAGMERLQARQEVQKITNTLPSPNRGWQRKLYRIASVMVPPPTTRSP